MSSLLLIPPIKINSALWERRCFDFITVIDGKKHIKQESALQYLTDHSTREIAYGGAAGGAKSWTGSAWLLMMCLQYPGTKWFIAREELKRLRDTTLLTFFKVAKSYGAVLNQDYKYNGQDHNLHFSNGSRIDLLEVKFLPSDPLYERYGSSEYTGGWIEEAGETEFIAFETLKSRIGRQYNDKYNIIPKVYVTFNPKKNYVYSYFYQPYKTGDLPPYRVFIPALLHDNPHRESHYEQQLEDMSKVQRERLLHGNFEYDDDPSALCDQDAINDLFTNRHVLQTGNKYISADLAMMGRDKFIAGHWDNLVLDLNKSVVKSTSTGKEIEATLRQMMQTHAVGRSRTIADSDGLGGYLESYLNGIKEFHGNGKPKDPIYGNVKDECGYTLADIVNRRMMYIICDKDTETLIRQELGVLKADDVDNDEGKKTIISKKDMKKLIGRSPDYLDILLMRMWFVIFEPKQTNKSWAANFG